MNIIIDKGAPISLKALIGLIIFYLLWTGVPVNADSEKTDIDYDIFLKSDTLTVWIDMKPLLTQPKMEDLLSGLDLTLLVDMKLERPRKLLLSKTITSARAAVNISHQLTEDIYRLKLVNFGLTSHEFENQLELSDFLSDSLVLKIAPVSMIDASNNLRLELKIVIKSHSNKELEKLHEARRYQREIPPERDEEFFESLFEIFLNLIGFGETSYRIASPPFSLDDLHSL